MSITDDIVCGFVSLSEGSLAPEKTLGPSTVLSFVEIGLDDINSEARLPEDNQIIEDFMRRKKV